LHDVFEFFCGTCDRYPGAEGEITVDASVLGGSPVGVIRVTESLVKIGGSFRVGGGPGWASVGLAAKAIARQVATAAST
jgi:hypothetical protein